MKPPIYEPSGKAKEYGDLALNIYTGCNHGCYYCFAPNVLHKTKEAFSTDIKPRDEIVEEVKRQLDKEQIKGKLIHLCFTCDPYPAEIDTSATREIIKLLKRHGNHVQILTKGGRRAERDFDLLDENDWFGVTYCGYPAEDRTIPNDASMYEPNAAPPSERLFSTLLCPAKRWVSIEPVLDARDALDLLTPEVSGYWFDMYRIGKLNYHPSTIDWDKFGREAEEICVQHRLNYYIKESLRKEMESA